MAAIVIGGPRTWTGSWSAAGYRHYVITFEVRTHVPGEGPAVVLTAVGLPGPGDVWVIDFDADLYAACTFERSCKPLVEREPNVMWEVEVTFSTKPLKTCQDVNPDPLAIPPKVGGGQNRFTEEAT